MNPSAANHRTPSRTRHAGRIGTPLAAILALAVLIGVGATQAYTLQHAASPATAVDQEYPTEPYASPARQVAPDAETYSESNPQPPTF